MSPEKLKTMETIKKLSDYEDLNVYSMDIKYPYELDHLTPTGAVTTQQLMDLCIREVLPGESFSLTAPKYGCSVFSERLTGAGQVFGRNYDFKFDTSAMIVNCRPQDGYASIGTAALDNIKVDDPFASDENKALCLLSPFLCLDGVNEKGVGIGVLTLDSEPTVQNTGKRVLATTILIRLVLDRAASTQEAIDLIAGYDAYAVAGRDYHFFITDRSGDSRIVEYDCDDPERKMTVTPTNAATNFYVMYQDRVLPYQKNGSYGHGKERYDAIEKVIADNKDNISMDVAWEALKAAQQLPNPDDVTSNTQWSIVYELAEFRSNIVLHRHWDDVIPVSGKRIRPR